MGKIDPEGLELKDKVVYINRVSKVVKGGRRFSFTALVVVGDGLGTIGVGKGKANEVPEAIRKGIERARRSLVTFPINGTSIHHRVIGRFGGGMVVMNPAKKGTGLIAGGPVRAVLEVAGVQDIVAKSLGGHNPQNTVWAAMDGLSQLRDPKEVIRIRKGRPADKQQAPQSGAPTGSPAAKGAANK